MLLSTRPRPDESRTCRSSLQTGCLFNVCLRPPVQQRCLRCLQFFFEHESLGESSVSLLWTLPKPPRCSMLQLRLLRVAVASYPQSCQLPLYLFTIRFLPAPTPVGDNWSRWKNMMVARDTPRSPIDDGSSTSSPRSVLRVHYPPKSPLLVDHALDYLAVGKE